MEFVYPASNDLSKLSSPALALKIARHSSCTACTTCPGLRPPRGSSVALDTSRGDSTLGDLTQYGSDDEDDPPNYLQTCGCGHGCEQHGVEDALGKEEVTRRGKVAIRIDELLGVRSSFLSD